MSVSSSNDNAIVSSAHIAASIAALDMVKVQLSDIAQDVESSVSGVCAGFQGMSVRARSAMSAATEALNTSSEGGGLPAFVHRVRMALLVLLHQVKNAHEFSTELQGKVDQLHSSLRDIFVLSERVSMTATRTFGKNLSQGEASLLSPIENARLLSDTASRNNARICETITDVCGELRELSNRLSVRIAEDNEASLNSEHTVRTILERLTSSYVQMSESLTTSASMGRQLNSDIAQAVMSMQFQDRVNQRIAHIIETISEVCSELQPHTHGADGSAQDRTQALMDRLAKSYTMDAERVAHGQVESGGEDTSIELF